MNHLTLNGCKVEKAFRDRKKKGDLKVCFARFNNYLRLKFELQADLLLGISHLKTWK